MELTFGEQIKIILKRRNMTIQDLAEAYESQTGIKMTRQNLSQRLKRDNFSEQDMHTFAAILGYQVSIYMIPLPEHSQQQFRVALPVTSPDISTPSVPEKAATSEITTSNGSQFHIPSAFCKQKIQGDINPLTGKEYLSNTVRQHPTQSGYVQVYDQSTHEWTDVNEDYFWEFQANKKQILGRDYQEPILI